MRATKILAFGLAIVMACSLMMTGCNKAGSNDVKQPGTGVSEQEIAKNGIQAENYLTLYTRGKNGHARLYADIDFIALKKDCAKFLVDDLSNVPENMLKESKATTPEDFLDYVFDHIDTYDLVETDKYEKLCNGDVANVTVDLPGRLSHILTVPVSGAEIKYTPRDLEEFAGLDPFEHTFFTYVDLVSVDGKIGYKLNHTAKLLLVLPDGTYTTLFCALDFDEGHVSYRGDTIRVAISEHDISRYAEQYGDDIFTRTEAEIKLEKIAYLPTGDNAKDAFEYMDEDCFYNVDCAAKEMMDHATKTKTTAERIGMMFFYDNEGILETDNDDKFYNQIVFIYKFTSKEHPEAWYSYMAYNGYIAVGFAFDFGTLEYSKAIGDIYGDSFTSDFRYYHNEHPRMYGGSYPSTFEYDGVEYPGHLDLADVFKAIETNLNSYAEYDHLIVTDGLKEYVDEY